MELLELEGSHNNHWIQLLIFLYSDKQRNLDSIFLVDTKQVGVLELINFYLVAQTG